MATRNINNYINELLNEDKYDRLVNATPEQKERLRELDRKREARESDPNTGKYSRTLRTGGLDAAITELEDDGKQDTVDKIKTGISNKTRRPVSADQSPTRTTPLTPEGKKKDDALVAAAQKDFDRYDRIEAGAHASADRSAKEAARIRAMVDADRKESEEFKKVLAAYKEKNRAGKGRADALKSGQGTNQEREERITDSQRAIMSDNAKSIASSIIKGFGAGRSTDKPRESFPSRGGKNKRLARAAQADKTGDAYADQVMGQGKGTPSSGADIEKFKIEKDRIKAQKRDGARPDSGIRDGMFRPGRDDQNYGPPRTGLAVYDPDRKYGPAIPRTDLFNRGGGSNLMPRQGPARADGPNIMPDMKRKRMELKSREITPTPSMGGY